MQADNGEEKLDEEYGLAGLDTLPLLEQVHRLYHAISMAYPYKEVGILYICILM